MIRVRDIMKDFRHKDKKSKSASKSAGVPRNGDTVLAQEPITKPVIDEAIHCRYSCPSR